MRNWRENLRTVRDLNRAVNPAKAESLLIEFFEACPPAVLRELGADVEATLGDFYPKRRRSLEEIFRTRSVSSAEPVPAVRPATAVPVADVVPVDPALAPADTDQVPVVVAEVALLIATVQPALAESRLRALVESLQPAMMTSHESLLRATVAEFLPKRRRGLETLLDERLAQARRETMVPVTEKPEPEAEPKANPPAQAVLVRTAPPASQVGPLPSSVPRPALAPRPVPTGPPANRLTVTRERFKADLDDLRNHHIFQWTTFYRDKLSEYFDTFLDDLSSQDSTGVLDVLRSCLSHHARQIYRKGYTHVTSANSGDPHYAVTKSLAGLQRFLDLPLEFYSAQLPEAHHGNNTRALRQLCSAMICGILHGYASAQFDQPGSKILPQFPHSWTHVLPFLTVRDLDELTPELEPGDLVDGLHDSVRPLVVALDNFLEQDAGSAPMPALSQYVSGTRRLDVSLQMPPNLDSQLVELQCYTSAQFVDVHLLEEASARAVGIVVAPLRSDLRARVESVERWSNLVVPTLGPGEIEPAKRLLARLEDLVYQNGSTSLDRPITFNYARTFPLENPFLTKYNHVYRSSVRRLMHSYERRNGVRLWCSVRRSGKTTACSADLGSTSGQSVVVAQTCDSTGQMADGDVFYKQIRGALRSGERLDDDFVSRTIDKCLPVESGPDTRVVLVLDEYETLFGDLKSSLGPRPELRYTVVQPLLNQLVAFTRDNLLIFMGQQPNAHFILLDQNQLSPVVEQDSFPLFPHDPAAASSGEFYELLTKVMTTHVQLDPDFVSEVYLETTGHPFLTVKLMVSFVDWLIAEGRPVSGLAPLRPELFREFAASQLTLKRIAHDPHFDFFRNAAAEHLSPGGRLHDNWLHSVYAAMRRLVLSSPETLALPVDDFAALAGPDLAGRSPHDLLSSGARANFLTYGQEIVRPRIPLLARIAASVRPL